MTELTNLIAIQQKQYQTFVIEAVAKLDRIAMELTELQERQKAMTEENQRQAIELQKEQQAAHLQKKQSQAVLESLKKLTGADKK